MSKKVLIPIIFVLIVFNIYFVIDAQKKGKGEKEFLSEIDERDNQIIQKDRIVQKNSELLKRNNAITEATSQIKKSVVSVNVIKTQMVRRQTNPFSNPFFGFFNYFPYAKKNVKSIGTGIVIDKKGHIITNSHVVEGATQITVVLENDEQVQAKIIGQDPIQDIAVLKIDKDNLFVAKLGNSSNLIIGEWAIAVGNPYAFFIKDSQPSVSVGVISAMKRNFAENSDGKMYKQMIQTDAAINPGNSGGPLVNILGEVIGINTFILSESGGNIGISFAIPIDRVKKVAEELIAYGKIRDKNYGFKVQEITPYIASYFDLQSKQGVIITFVDKSSAADKAGLERGDILLQINQTEIYQVEDAELAVSDTAVGDLLNISIIRNGKQKRVSYKLKEFK
ncbi:MAG: trypsin-like peptidase domain-containing protein [Candidatus Cloacimonadota bacterium]|nr:trypsin-like peptidase domain-containing protein [Candidatus Cloacimonadota bacterium]